MKRIIILLCLIIGLNNALQSQEIVFSKFELKKSYLSYNLNFVFSNQIENAIKYLEVSYLCINDVNDAVGDDIRKAKRFSFKSTGPFIKGKKVKHTVPNAVWKKINISPYPYRIILTYMDGTIKEIDIRQNNLSEYFPSVEHIDINDFENVIQEPIKQKADDNVETITNEFPTNEIGEFEFKQIKETNLSKDILFANARNWLSNNFNNYKENIQIDDKDEGKLVFNANHLISFNDTSVSWQNKLTFKIIIDIKDYKYRITINNFNSELNRTGIGILKGKLNRFDVYTPLSRKEDINKLKGTEATVAYSAQIKLYNLEYEYVLSIFNSLLKNIEVIDDF